MNKQPVLVVLAAGMGSRYGGLKQIDAMGSQGEALLDYSIYDAHAAGFQTVVIIIKEAIRQEFMDTVAVRLQKAPVEIRYAYQELDMLPAGYSVPEGRSKPWGTSHAVFCAREAIGDAPFAVIDADDYYGRECFRLMYNALANLSEETPYRYFMVGYPLCKTVTVHGAVTRGCCQVDEQGMLKSIVERTQIARYPGGFHYTEDNGATWTDLSADTVVSMNFWGFTPGILPEIEKQFAAFLADSMIQNPLRCEFYLPMTVEHLLRSGKAEVSVMTSPDQWYGVTYAADKPGVIAALRRMTDAGMYPDGLWK